MQTSYDCVVIGGGHNGLVAAGYLGRAGLSVLLIEKAEELGGATASTRIFPEFDARISRYSYLVSLLPQQIIDDLELDFSTRRREIASFTPYRDGQGNHRGLLLSNVDPQRSRASVLELTGRTRDWDDYQRLLRLETRIAEVVWPSLLRPLPSREALEKRLNSPEQKEAWQAFVERPVGEVIERYLHHDLLRGLVLTDAKIGVFTHAHDPTLLQNRCFLYHVVGGGNGEWRVPVGGMGALVQGLAKTCRKANVDLRTKAIATEVQTDGQQATVHFRMGDRVHQVDTRHVLITAGPRTTARLLGQHWSPDATDEGSVIKMNLLLKRLPRIRAQGVEAQEAFCGSLHIDEGYEQMQQAYERASQGEIPDPAPGEIYCHSITDPSILSANLQDSGFHTLTFFGLDMPYRLFADDHDHRRQLVSQRYLQGLDRICDEPLMDCVARTPDGEPCIEIKTPQDLEREIDLDQGNIFHNAPSWFFAEKAEQVGRWGVETQYENVLRAGSSAARGGAVSGIPGYCAAQRVLEQRERVAS